MFINKRTAGHAVRAVTLLWLVCHFALTLIYAFPMNPIKMKLFSVTEAVIGTYFPQNWSMFAPNPLQSNQSLLVRCMGEAEYRATQGDGGGDWQNLSASFWEHSQRNRLSVYDRLVRPQSSAMRSYMGGVVTLEPFRESCKKGDQDSCKAYEERLELYRLTAAGVLKRVGSAFCLETSQPGTYSYVAVRMRDEPAVPWSARDGGAKRDHVDYSLGVFPIDPEAARPGIFRAGGGE